MTEKNSASPELSDRGLRFLATLTRYPAASKATLEDVLQQQGLPLPEAWLTFQEHYAGYESNIGLDGMVWGLIHPEIRYSAPGAAVLTMNTYTDSDTGRLQASCADIHPSYVMELDENGTLCFQDQHYSSFDLFIERSAQYVEFREKGEATEYWDNANPDVLNKLNEQAELNDNLSDQYLELWEGDKVMGTRIPGNTDWEHIVSLLPKA